MDTTPLPEMPHSPSFPFKAFMALLVSVVVVLGAVFVWNSNHKAWAEQDSINQEVAGSLAGAKSDIAKNARAIKAVADHAKDLDGKVDTLGGIVDTNAKAFNEFANGTKAALDQAVQTFTAFDGRIKAVEAAASEGRDRMKAIETSAGALGTKVDGAVTDLTVLKGQLAAFANVPAVANPTAPAPVAVAPQPQQLAPSVQTQQGVVIPSVLRPSGPPLQSAAVASPDDWRRTWLQIDLKAGCRTKMFRPCDIIEDRVKVGGDLTKMVLRVYFPKGNGTETFWDYNVPITVWPDGAAHCQFIAPYEGGGVVYVKK